MIYTVTFNPSIDYIVRLEQFTTGEINRVNYEQILPGGKGINVSIVLKNLGHDSTALGFLAGFTGIAMQQQLCSFGVTDDFVRLDEGFSRINVKIKAESETEINGQGPVITEEAQRALFEKLDRLTHGDTLVLAGSIPNTLPDDIYERIMERLDGRGIRIVVDATKNLLRRVLKYRPFLIKPNNHELGEMFGAELKTDDEIVFHAKKTAGGRRDKRAHLDGKRRCNSPHGRGRILPLRRTEGDPRQLRGRRRFDGCGLPRGLHGIGRQL